jgi:hypothetical protein
MRGELFAVVAAGAVLPACGDASFDASSDAGSAAPDSSLAAPDADVPPAVCARTCAAAALDDGSPLRAAPGPPPTGPLRTLVVVPAVGADWPAVEALAVHLEGFGSTFDRVTDADLGAAELERYSAVAVLGSAWARVALDDAGVARLADALDRGRDVLWMGPGLPAALAPRFGLRPGAEARADTVGARTIRFRGTGGRLVETPARDAWLATVALAGADALATFEPAGLPAVTHHRTPGGGCAVHVPFDLADGWGEARGADAWARAELLFDALIRTRSRGAVRRAPFPDGHAGALLIRIEGVHPGGTRAPPRDEAWVRRFAGVVDRLDALGMRAHLAIVARYVDPALAESFAWDAPGAARERLRAALRRAVAARGAVLVSHGWTHQQGRRDGDRTGADREMSDDASGAWVHLPYERQRDRLRAAREALFAAFGATPRAWRTPALDGDAATYRAAAEVGFELVTEGHGHLFPNRSGRDGLLGGHLFDVPTTGGAPSLAAAADVLPRLARIGAPFFLATELRAPDQAERVITLAECAAACDLWTPTAAELADWWARRGAVRITARSRADAPILEATVRDHPPGLTLLVRLPDGTAPRSVTVDGASAPFVTHRDRGVAHARVVLDDEAPTAVQVRYGP